MESDGTLIVKTDIDNSEFEDDLEDLEDMVEDAGEDAGEGFSKGFEKKSSKINGILSKLLSKMTGLGRGMTSAITTFITAVVGAGVSLGAIVGILSIIIGAIYILAKAFVKVFKENEQLKVNIQYLIWAVGQALQPAVDAVANVLTFIIKLLVKAVAYTLTLLNMLTGGKMFQNAGADKFAESLNNAEDSAGGLASNLKDAKKQLAGFDEMNVLSDNNAGGGGAGAGATTPSITMPDIDFAKYQQDIEDFYNKWMEKGEEARAMLFDMPFDVWTEAFGKWDLAVYGVTQTFYGLWEQITGFFEFFKGLWDFIIGLITGDTDRMKKGFVEMLDGLWKIIDGTKNFIVGVWNTLIGVAKGAVITICEWIDWLKEKGIEIFWKLAGIIGNVWNSIKDTIWGKILEIYSFLVSIFATMGATLGNAVGGALKGIINAILETLENKINSFIRGINTAVGVINLIPGVDIGKMSMVKFPRLAKGGIVSNPGPGVMMGSYIAGENGAEAVLPLTDDTLQRLANMIPITVNVTNTMNGKVLSRELQRVQNETNFAFNR